MDDNMVQQRDIGKLWGAMERTNGDIKELRVALVGIDGTNGLRGELREFIQSFKDDHAVRLDEVEKRVEEGIAMGKHMYHIERHKPGECIGKAALDAHLADMAAREKKVNDRDKYIIAMIGSMIVALITSGASVFVAMQNTGVAP